MPVAVQRGLWPEPAAEPEPVVLCVSVRWVGSDVVQVQAEPRGQPPDLGVLGGDELRVLLGVLPAVVEAAQRDDAPAWLYRVVLVDVTADAVPGPQPVGAAEPGEARADDHHPRVRAGQRPRRAHQARGQGNGQGGGSRTAEHGAPGHAGAVTGPAAARPGRVALLEFYIDRDAGLAAAGLAERP